jgi:hypothetical protein
MRGIEAALGGSAHVLELIEIVVSPSVSLTLRRSLQATNLMVIGNDHKRSLEEISQTWCPELSIQQLYRLCTMHTADEYRTEMRWSPARCWPG